MPQTRSAFLPFTGHSCLVNHLFPAPGRYALCAITLFQPPFPMVRASPSQSLGESENCDFTDSIQRLHVELNVRVSDTGGKNVKAGTGENKDEDGGGGGGGGKCSEIIDGFGIGIDGKGNTKCRGPAKQPAGDFGISTASRTISTLAAAATDGTRSSSSLLAAEHAAASRSLDVCVT